MQAAYRRFEEIGFKPTDLRQLGIVPGMSGARLLVDDFRQRIRRYREQRDYPAIKGVSYLSVHLRFGTVSIRDLVSIALRRTVHWRVMKVLQPGLRN